MAWIDDWKKKAEEYVQNTIETAKSAYNTASNAYNTAKDVYDTASTVVNNAVNTGKDIANTVMDYAPGVIDTAKNVTNAAVNSAKDLYNADANAVTNVHNAETGQGNASQPVDMLAEYDNYTASATTPTGTTTGSTNSSTNGSTTSNPSELAFSSAYTAQVDDIMNKIMNREKFSYDMNADAMYQQYKDQYIQQANLANQNAQAQNAALTGGYGSSYGQMVGQQAYAQQMQGLNDIGMDLYQQALNQYMMEGDQLYNQYSMLANREAQDYSRYLDDRNYNYQVGRDAIADQQWADEFQWMKDQHESLYGENGFYATESDKDRTHQKGMQDDAQEHESSEADKDRTHQKGMQDDAQEHESLEADKNRTHASEEAEKDRTFTAEENEKDRTFTAEENKKARDWQTSENATEYEKMYGDFERNADGSLKLDADGNPIGGGYYTRQAWQQHQYDEEEWQRMYGAIEYDDDGNIIGGGYYTVLAATEREWAEEDWDKMYADFDRDADGNIIYDENGNPQGGGYYTRQAWQERKYDEEDWNKMYGPDGYYTKLAKEEKEASNPNTTYEGDGMLNGQEVPKQLAGVQGLTTTNTNFFDDNGYFKQAAVVGGTDSAGDPIEGNPEVGKGKMTYNIGGKEITVKTGTSPYTNTINPDAKNGVFDNGYQPNNIKGKQLTEVDGEEACVNGQWVSVYSLPDGTWYAYDAANNTYIKIDREETEGTTTPPTPTEPTTPTTPTEPTTSNIPEPLKKFNGGPIKDARGIMEKTDVGLSANGTTDVNPQPMKGVISMMQNQGGFPDEVGEALGTLATGTNSAPAYNVAQGYGSISDLGFGPLSEERIQELIASGTILEYPEGSGMYIKLK